MKYKTATLLPSAIVAAVLAGCGGGGDAPPLLTIPPSAGPAPVVAPVAATPTPGASPAPVATAPAPSSTPAAPSPAPVASGPAPGPSPAPGATPAPAPATPVSPTPTSPPVAVTVAPTCAAFVNGVYQLVSPKASNDEQLASKVTFDAATLKTTAANGTSTQWTADPSACSFSAPNATLQISKSGLGVLRSVDASGNGVFNLIFPAQNFSLSELAGELNYISFDQVSGDTTYSVVAGTYLVSGTGEFLSGTICMFSTFCNPSSAPSRVTANPAGGFNYKDVNDSNLRAFGFKAADGSKIFIAVRANAGGIVIAAPRVGLNSYVQNLSPRALEINSSGVVSQLANRQLIGLGTDRPNAPFNGFAILNTDSTGSSEIAIPLPKMGVIAWINPSDKSFGFAVDR
jgi:hypothetical protein